MNDRGIIAPKRKRDDLVGWQLKNHQNAVAGVLVDPSLGLGCQGRTDRPSSPNFTEAKVVDAFRSIEDSGEELGEGGGAGDDRNSVVKGMAAQRHPLDEEVDSASDDFAYTVDMSENKLNVPMEVEHGKITFDVDTNTADRPHHNSKQQLVRSGENLSVNREEIYRWVSYEGGNYQFATRSVLTVFDLLKSAFDRLVVEDGRKLSEYQLRLRGEPVDNMFKLSNVVDLTEPLELVCKKSFRRSPAEVLVTLQKGSYGLRSDQIIAPRNLEIPFALRQDEVKILTDGIVREANLSPLEKVDKNCHRIPVLSTISGFGKTRTLLQVREVLPSLNTKQRVWKTVYLTFNQGYEESEWEVASPSSVEALLAWRVLYFYFFPDLSWGQYVAQIKRQDDSVLDMSLESAFLFIIDDVRLTNSLDVSTEVVLTLLIDEYQHISLESVDPSCVRLRTVVKALSSIMTNQSIRNNGILVPVFAGLFLLPLAKAALALSVQLNYVTMRPFDYDAASALVRHFSKDESILCDPQARRIVFQLSAVPGYLVDVLRWYEGNADWQESFKKVLLARAGSAKLTSEAMKLIYYLIACSITKMPVPRRVCSDIVLDSCGFCWFRDRAEGTVCVPFTMIYTASRGLQSRLDSPVGGSTYDSSFKESLALLGKDSLNPVVEPWKALECLKPAHTALKINAQGMLLENENKNAPFLVPLPSLLEGAELSDASRSIELSCQPISVRRSITELTHNHTFDGNDGWVNGGVFMLATDNQPVVDAYAVFRNCQISTTHGNIKVFDLLFFDQSKLRPNGGLVPKTYEEAAPWCREVVASYKRTFPDIEVGFIFGVRDPVKSLSPQMRRQMNTLSDADALEFYYGLGRKECMIHYEFLSGHPALVTRVYINDKTLTPPVLALALPSSWTYPHLRAESILERRPSNGYTDWNEVANNARLLDESTGHLEVPTNEETAIYFK